MDYRRNYDYQNRYVYGCNTGGYQNGIPYGMPYRNYEMSRGMYNGENMGQMPFYNRIPGGFEDRNEAEEERDIAYMREMYPVQVKEIMRQVEEMCDRIDYEGSMMYDEYPDRVMLQNMCRQIYDKVSYLDTTGEGMQMPEMEPMPLPAPVPEENAVPTVPQDMAGGEDMTAMQCESRNCNPFQDLIEVLLYQEMQRRRRRRRNRRRYW